MSQKHFSAVRALIEADQHLNGLVNDTVKVTDGGKYVQETYVVLAGGVPEALDDNRLAKGQDVDSDAEYVYDVRCVAVDAGGARGLADSVIASLVGKRIIIEGRKCDPIRLSHAEPVDFDKSVRPPLAVIDLEFVLYSRRRS